MRKILIAAFLALFLVGCGPSVTDGEVIDKKFVPAHTETTSTFNPTTNMVEFDTDDIPDEWFVTVEKKCEDGKVRQARFKVTKDTYDRLKKGDWFGVK